MTEDYFRDDKWERQKYEDRVNQSPFVLEPLLLCDRTLSQDVYLRDKDSPDTFTPDRRVTLVPTLNRMKKSGGDKIL